MGSTDLGSEFRYGIGAGFEASPVIRIIVDGFGATKFSSKNGTNSLEIDGGGVVTPLGSPFGILLGGGAGVIEGVGVPSFRAILGVTYTVEAKDRDGDGIPDNKDQCPTQAEDKDGFEDADGCPDPDNDGDTILDKDDKCPNQAEDSDGFQDTDGCPDPDNDQDGVDDAHDQCPDKKETVNGFKDDDGCPDEPDKDGDGVPDSKDQCPDQPEDTDGFQDTDGCPDPDNDGDGINDEDDECVDEAEDKDGYQDEDGCPEGGKNGKGKACREASAAKGASACPAAGGSPAPAAPATKCSTLPPKNSRTSARARGEARCARRSAAASRRNELDSLAQLAMALCPTHVHGERALRRISRSEPRTASRSPMSSDAPSTSDAAHVGRVRRRVRVCVPSRGISRAACRIRRETLLNSLSSSVNPHPMKRIVSIVCCTIALVSGGGSAFAQPVGDLIQKLEEGSDFRVRVQAALELGKTHGRSARLALETALDDENAAVRAAAAAGLKVMRNPDALCLAAEARERRLAGGSLANPELDRGASRRRRGDSPRRTPREPRQRRSPTCSCSSVRSAAARPRRRAPFSTTLQGRRSKSCASCPVLPSSRTARKPRGAMCRS